MQDFFLKSHNKLENNFKVVKVMSIYSDIAVECVNSMFKRKENTLDYGCYESVIKIDSTRKQNEYNKPKGEYYLLDCPNLHKLAPIVYEYIIMQLSSYIKCKIANLLKKPAYKILVCCLGNENLVSDSLGCKVFDKIISSVGENENENTLMSIKTSVYGKTGIKTADFIKSISEISNADLVIVIDALCSSSISRIGTSIQVTDSGIVAGGAMGASGKLINAQFLHKPTIVIGIPFVVRVETIIKEVLSNLSDNDLEDTKTISAKSHGLIVTPKDIDSMVELGSYIIASAINNAVLDLDINEQRLLKL